MRRLIIIATAALVFGASGTALAQQPAADRQAVPPEAKAPPAAAPVAAEKPPVQPAGQAGTTGSMVDPNTAGGPPGPPPAQPATAPGMPPNTGAPAHKVPVSSKQPAAGGKVSEAKKAEFLQALESDQEWLNEFKQNLFDRIVKDPKTTMDHTLRAQMADTLRPEIHEDDANRMLRNKQHVVYAYAALWILTALFVLFMFLKQRTLNDEIERLRADLEEAAE